MAILQHAMTIPLQNVLIIKTQTKRASHFKI